MKSTALSLLYALVQFAIAIVRWLERREMREDAERAVGDDVDELAKLLGRRSKDARSRVSHDDDSVRNDPHNRDNFPGQP